MAVARPVQWIIRLAPTMLFVGVAFAQGTNDTGADVAFSKTANPTPQETLIQAKKYSTDMQDTLKRMLGLQDQAQRSKDVIKLNCINDKITQTRGHLAIADKSMVDLTDAINKSDDSLRQHEFTRLTILHQKVDVLMTEANNCVGEDITYFGDQRVTVEIDPSIPQTDPTDVPPPQLEAVPRPTEASPSL